MMNNHIQKSNHSKYPIIVLTLCAVFLFYKYILQIYPSVITEQLMHDFNLTGTGLGYLGGIFYYTYMVMQLFVGVLLDRYGARCLTTLAILCCALGIFFFSQTHILLHLQLSRALMGVGVAFATVAYMKLALSWFPPERYAFVTGLLATAAMTGAVFGQAPLAFAINAFGWRESLMVVGLAGFALTIAFGLMVRDKKHVGSTHKKHLSFQDVLTVFKSKQNWLLTLYSGLAFSPVAIFGGLWGNPFVQQAYHLSKTETASLISLVFIGLGIGSPIIGLISDRFGDRRNTMIYFTLLGCVAISLVLYCHMMPIWLLAVCLFTFGFAIGAYMLVFAIGTELNNPRLIGTVVAMINASDAILDGVTEPAIGKLLDLNWDGTILNGVHYFSLHSYYIAFSVMPIFLLLATLFLLGVKQHKRVVN